MSNMFFWIIILSFLIPFAMRMYRKSVRGRNQNQGFNGQYPGQFRPIPRAAAGAPEQPAPGRLHPTGLLRRRLPSDRRTTAAPARPAVPGRRLPEPRLPSQRLPESGPPEPRLPCTGRPRTGPLRGQPRLSGQPVTPAATAAAFRPGNSPAPLGAPGLPRAETGRAGPAVQQRRDRHGGIHVPAQRDHEGLDTRFCFLLSPRALLSRCRLLSPQAAR